MSLRDIAAEADVHFALIRRYIGNRDELVNAVFADVSDQLARRARAPPRGSGVRCRHGDGQVGAHRGRARDHRTAACGSHRIQSRARDGEDADGRLRPRRAFRACCAPRRSLLRRWGGGSSRTTWSSRASWGLCRSRRSGKSWSTRPGVSAPHRGRLRRIRHRARADLACRHAAGRWTLDLGRDRRLTAYKRIISSVGCRR